MADLLWKKPGVEVDPAMRLTHGASSTMRTSGSPA